MKPVQSFFTFAIIILIINGCGNKKESVYLNTLDRLEEELAGIEKRIDKVDTSAILKIDRDILFIINQMNDLKEGTISEISKEVAEFVSIRRPILTFFRDYKANHEFIEKYRDEFDVIRKNFQKGNIDEALLAQKVAENEIKVNEFCNLIRNNLDNVEAKTAVYETLAPLIREKLNR